MGKMRVLSAARQLKEAKIPANKITARIDDR